MLFFKNESGTWLKRWNVPAMNEINLIKHVLFLCSLFTSFYLPARRLLSYITKPFNWNKFFAFFYWISENQARDTMRSTLAMIFVLNFVLSCSSMKTSRVPAKAEGCVEENNCGTLCEYDGHKFFPGTNRTLHREFTCLEITCTDDFHVIFEP